jgi:hypothetical protein
MGRLCGFKASSGGFLWEASVAEVRAIRVLYGDVPLLVCTYDHRQQWNGAVGVVRLPFKLERVALALGQALRRTEGIAA